MKCLQLTEEGRGCAGEDAPNTIVGYKPLNSTTEFQEEALPHHSSNNHHRPLLDT